MTISPPVALGVQTPRLLSVPPHVPPDGDSPGALAVELAASAGLYLDPWQEFVLRRAMLERADRKWAAREVALVVPRQCGKGSVLEALELAGLFLPEPDGPPPLLLHSAHEYKTADEHFRRMRDLIDGSERLRKQIRIVRTASGAQSIELVTGARLRFVTRTSGSGRGFSADTIVIDEAYNLNDEAMAAVLPTLSARPNPQIWYTSSAGMESSSVLARVRARGQSGSDPKLAYFEWSAPDDADLDDPQAWAQANPALGYRITLDAIEGERAAMSDDQFARERLGMWPDATRRTAIAPGLFAALADPESTVLDPVTFAVDVTPDRMAASIAVAGRRADGLVHAEVVENRPGTAWVVDRVAELAGKWRCGPVRLLAKEPLAFDLEKRRLDVSYVGAGEYAQACAGLTDLVAAQGLRWRARPELAAVLTAAVSAARKKAQGEAFTWARRDATDISPLVSVTLAAHGVAAHVERRAGSFFAFN